MKNIRNLSFLIVLSFALSGCLYHTVAPKPVVSAVSSYAGENPNSGLISTITDNKGQVTAAFINKQAYNNYNALISKYGNDMLPKLKKDDGIVVVSKDEIYKIDGEHFSKFALMAKWYKEGK